MGDQQEQSAKSALNKTGQRNQNHVAFVGEATSQQSKEKPKLTAAPLRLKISIPPPPTGFVLKDEVELLRQGFKNTHGEQVKTQGRANGAKKPDKKTGAVEIEM